MSEASWMEVSLLLDGELVEAVAEVLRRFAPDGVAIESTGVSSRPDDSEGHAVGLLRVCAYLPVDSDLEEKRRKLEDIAMLLQGAIAALGKVGLMLNVRRCDLEAVLQVLPALQRPTISSLSDEEWLAVNTIIDESVVRLIIPRLKEVGAQGIVEYPLNKIVM